ncbi:hypothetical protein LINGRAPRIM_LOCUS896 [Linum grandiflorum]
MRFLSCSIRNSVNGIGRSLSTIFTAKQIVLWISDQPWSLFYV